MDEKNDLDKRKNTSLWNAYRTTTYEAYIGSKPTPIRIKIGHHSPAVDTLLKTHGVNNWIFITAWNPGQARPSRETNQAQNQALQAELMSLGLPFFPGLGRGTDPAWDPEESFLALGIDIEQGIHLARKYGQFAIVAGLHGSKAQLIDCRPDQ